MKSMDPYTQYYIKLLNLKDDFIENINTPLPPSFRLNRESTFYKEAKIFFAKHNLPYIENFLHDDIFLLKIRRGELKKVNPDFYEVLKSLTTYGIIINQEIVSMLPVLILEKILGKNERRVALDMCAAPGSKSRQLVELFDFVIANDSNKKRLSVLNNNLMSHFKTGHRIKNYTITNYDGKCFPFVDGINAILCDVPCSGDGTVRKTNFNRKKFAPEKAINLRKLQLGILRRAIEIAEYNKEVYLIYSTCSMNPLENEYIVNEILAEKKYHIELVDISNMFPQFSKGMNLYGNSELEKTVRCTISENTGGFYVALFKITGQSISKMKEVENKFLVDSGQFNIKNRDDFIFTTTTETLNNIYLLKREYEKYYFRNTVSFGAKILKREKDGYRLKSMFFLADDNFSITKEQLSRLIEGELLIEELPVEKSFNILQYKNHYLPTFKYKNRFVLYFDKLIIKKLLLY